jgi:hypothetical protein
MDGKRIDVVSRAFAGRDRVSRRRAVGRFGAGGFGAGLLAAVGLGQGRSRAAPATARQGDEADGFVCIFDFEATVRIGPSSEERGTRRIAGELQLGIDREGGGVGGILILEDGEKLDVQGQATGRSVSLRISFGDGDALVLVGAGFSPFAECNVGYSGPASGPRPGDLGDWRTELNPGPVPGFCPDEPTCLMDAPCPDGTLQTTECDCVTTGNAVCDRECEGDQSLTDNCECVCLA